MFSIILMRKCTCKPQWDLTTHLSEWIKWKTVWTSNISKNAEKLHHLDIAGRNGECEMVQSLWKISLVVSYKTKHATAIQLSSCTPGYLFQESEDLCSHTNLNTNVHGSSICNGLKLETTQISFNGWMIKQTWVCTSSNATQQ